MKINKITTAILSVILLAGCKDENKNTTIIEVDEPRDLSQYDTLTPEMDTLRDLSQYETLTPGMDTLRDLSQYETLTPSVDPLRDLSQYETLTPTIDPLRDLGQYSTLTPQVKPSYIINNRHIVDISSIDREYTEAFTLDDISVQYNSIDNNYTIINGSPRYINNPTLNIDGTLYTLETLLEPFQTQTFPFETYNGDQVSSIQYVEEQPYFRSHVNGYQDMVNENFTLPTAEHALGFEQELRGYKNAANDFTFTAYFADYITNYGKETTTRSLNHRSFNSLTFDYADCPYGHEHEHPMVRSGNDSSDPNVKILSYLNHEPVAKHHMTLMAGYAGYATIGNGWLSVRDYTLYKEGQTSPATTYLHEKGHNHGFSHNGGMTYGLPELLTNYIRDNDALLNYYDSPKLAKTIPRAVVVNKHVFDGDYINTQFTFLSQVEPKIDFQNVISRFMLILPNGIDDDITVSAVINGESKNLVPTGIYAEGKVLVFETGFEIDILDFSDQFVVTENYINVRMLTPTNDQSFSVFATGYHADWSTQANKVIDLTANTTGLKTDNGQFVFYDMENSFNESGVIEEVLVEYTPEEATKICLDKGFSGLGMLQPYKSAEQMNFQMLYLPWKSQVGIDPDTLEAVAVLVESSYRPEYTSYTEKGSLVVCE